MLLIGSETLSANPGKIEAFNGFCTTNFIAEVKASNIITLDQLNEAFLVWVDEDARQYLRFHLERAEGPAELFTDNAAQTIFHIGKGLPRVIKTAKGDILTILLDNLNCIPWLHLR